MTVVGPAGVGKTRLTSDFVRLLGGAATAVTGRCLSYGQGLTFWPLREIVAELAGTEDGDSPDEVLTRVARLLPADDDRATVAERVAGALGVVESTALPGGHVLGGAQAVGGGRERAPARGRGGGCPVG